MKNLRILNRGFRMLELIPRRFARIQLPIFVALPFLAACGRGLEPSVEVAPPPPMPVSAEAVRATTDAYRETVPGQVKPVHAAVVSARIQGEIERLPVVPGQNVTRGDLLAELLSEDHEARVRGAEAELEAASQELDRIENLRETQAATQRELEAAEARQRSAEAALAEAQTFLDYATVHAPFDGVVASKHVEVGDLVSPGEPIVDVYSPDAFRLEVWVSESLVQSFSPGDEMDFEINSAGLSGSGTVDEIEPGVDSATRTVLVKVDLPNSEEIRSGQYGQVFVDSSPARRLIVSETSLLRRGQLEYVFVISGDPPIARLRLVRTKPFRDGQTEILAGLNDGETVVTNVPSDLRDGHQVEID